MVKKYSGGSGEWVSQLDKATDVGERKLATVEFDPSLVKDGASLVARAVKGDSEAIERIIGLNGHGVENIKEEIRDILTRVDGDKVVAYIRLRKPGKSAIFSEESTIIDAEAASLLLKMDEGYCSTVPGIWVGKTISPEKKEGLSN